MLVAVCRGAIYHGRSVNTPIQLTIPRCEPMMWDEGGSVGARSAIEPFHWTPADRPSPGDHFFRATRHCLCKIRALRSKLCHFSCCRKGSNTVAVQVRIVKIGSDPSCTGFRHSSHCAGPTSQHTPPLVPAHPRTSRGGGGGVRRERLESRKASPARAAGPVSGAWSAGRHPPAPAPHTRQPHSLHRNGACPGPSRAVPPTRQRGPPGTRWHPPPPAPRRAPLDTSTATLGSLPPPARDRPASHAQIPAACVAAPETHRLPPPHRLPPSHWGK